MEKIELLHMDIDELLTRYEELLLGNGSPDEIKQIKDRIKAMANNERFDEGSIGGPDKGDEL